MYNEINNDYYKPLLVTGDEKVTIAVFGAISSGKTSFLNAILKQVLDINDIEILRIKCQENTNTIL